MCRLLQQILFLRSASPFVRGFLPIHFPSFPSSCLIPLILWGALADYYSEERGCCVRAVNLIIEWRYLVVGAFR